MEVKETPLFYMGDIVAPKGTYAHTVAVHEAAKAALNNASFTREEVQTWIKALRDDDCFRQLKRPDGEQFFLWEDFCTTPQPRGLGYSPEAIEAIVSERESIEGMAAKAQPVRKRGRPKREEKLDYIKFSEEGGTHAGYLTARIAAQRPDILDRMKAGEFKSVRAAAREAGFVRDPTRVELLQRNWRKASEAEREAFRAWIDEE